MGDKTQTTTPAGRYLTQRMEDLGFKTKAELADTAGVSRSTITRLYSNPDYRPDIHNMRRIATALDVDPEVLVAAIYGEAPATPPSNQPPLAAELTRMLGDDSPLAEDSRLILTLLVDRVLELGRRQARSSAFVESDRDEGSMRALRNQVARGIAPTDAGLNDEPDPLEAKLERVQSLDETLNPTDRRRLRIQVDMLLEWMHARGGVPEMTAEEREGLERLQRATRAHDEAMREHLDAQPAEPRREPAMRRKPAGRDAERVGRSDDADVTTS